MTRELLSNKMKTIVLLCVTFSLAYADPSTTSPGSTETSNKSETKSPNSIPSAPATPSKSQYYSARTPTYVQLIQKPLFTAHHPSGVPQTMLIIAQPALLPHNLVYNQASNQHAQQLLNYFHSNPSSKYQLLYNYQPQTAQTAQTTPTHQQSQQQQQVSIPQSQTPVYYTHATPHSYQNYQYLTPQQYYIQPQHFGIPQYTQSSPSYHTPQYQIPASTYSQLQQYQLAPQSQTHQQQQQHGTDSTSSTPPFVPSQQIPSSLAQTLHQVSSQLHTQYQHPQQVQHLQQLQHIQTQVQGRSQPQSLHTQTHQTQSQTQNQPQYSSHYYSQGPQTFTTQTPIKTVAPIITGLENFTPEQQAQIKEQLSSHFGGVTQINSNSLQANNPEYQTKFRIEVQSPDPEYTSSQTQTQTQTQTESNNLKADPREEQQPTIQHTHHQHQPHYLTQTQSTHSQQESFVPPVYTYRTPQYTKG